MSRDGGNFVEASDENIFVLLFDEGFDQRGDIQWHFRGLRCEGGGGEETTENAATGGSEKKRDAHVLAFSKISQKLKNKAKFEYLIFIQEKEEEMGKLLIDSTRN